MIAKFLQRSFLWFVVIKGHEYDTNRDYTSTFTRSEWFYLDCAVVLSLSLVNTFVHDWLVK